MQQAVAAALQRGGQGQGGGAAPPQGVVQSQPGAQQQEGVAQFAQFAQAFARCMQNPQQCSPQDIQVLRAVLPKLMQTVQQANQIVQKYAQQQGGGNVAGG